MANNKFYPELSLVDGLRQVRADIECIKTSLQSLDAAQTELDSARQAALEAAMKSAPDFKNFDSAVRDAEKAFNAAAEALYNAWQTTGYARGILLALKKDAQRRERILAERAERRKADRDAQALEEVLRARGIDPTRARRAAAMRR